MNQVLWFVVSLVSLWVSVIWAFIAVMHAKLIVEREKLTLFWRVHMVPLALVGIVLDALFNLVFGTIMFRERPHELLFTSRVKRHSLGSGRRKRLADWWARNLNQIDPGHV
jgi:hypothetical protein